MENSQFQMDKKSHMMTRFSDGHYKTSISRLTFYSEAITAVL